MRALKLSAICLLLISFEKAYSQCELFMKYGIYDYEDISHNREQFIYNKLIKQTYDNVEDLKSVFIDLGITIPIEGIPVNATGTFDKNKTYVRNFQDYLEAHHSDYLKEEIRRKTKTINYHIISLVKECIGKPGLHVWLERTDNPDIFIINTLHKPAIDEKPKADIKTFSILPAGSTFFDAAHPLQPRKNAIGISGASTTVERKKGNKETIVVTLTSNPKEHWITGKSVKATFSSELTQTSEGVFDVTSDGEIVYGVVDVPQLDSGVKLATVKINNVNYFSSRVGLSREVGNYQFTLSDIIAENKNVLFSISPIEQVKKTINKQSVTIREKDAPFTQYGIKFFVKDIPGLDPEKTVPRHAEVSFNGMPIKTVYPGDVIRIGSKRVLVSYINQSGSSRSVDFFVY